MKKCALVVFAIQIALCLSQQYTTRYDSLDIDTVLSNKRVLNNYVKCILDEGPCTPEGRELKNHIPEALSTSCAKCTDSQRKLVRRGANFLIKNQPNAWNKITKKYDPQRKFSAQFNDFLKS